MEKLLETCQEFLYLYQVMEVGPRLVLLEMMELELILDMSEYFNWLDQLGHS
jgi:hypothetical protein